MLIANCGDTQILYDANKNSADFVVFAVGDFFCCFVQGDATIDRYGTTSTNLQAYHPPHL